MTHPALTAINFECSEPRELAHFWASLLGGEIVLETQGYCATTVDELYLGAVMEPHQPNPAGSRVFRDPAGHPFCLRVASKYRAAASLTVTPFGG